MLPAGWKRSTVGEACAIKNHLRLPLSKEERSAISGPYPYFGPTGVLSYIDHYRIDEEFALIGEDGDHFLKFQQHPMTLTFSGKANVNNHAHIIGNSDACLAKWFHFWFMHRDITRVLSRQGVGRYKLTKAGLEALEIWLPLKNEQKRIADALTAWDQSIATAERLLGNSRKQKQALIHALLSDTLRARRGLVPLARKQASELFVASSIRRNGDLDLLSVMQDVGVVPRHLLPRKVVMPEGSTEGYKLVEPGDFVISLRSFEGGLEYSRHTGLVSPAYTVLKAKLPICKDFYRHYFKSKDFISRLAVAVIGIRDGKQISYSDFASLRVPYPDLDSQKATAVALNAAEAVTNQQKAQLDHLKNEKAALLSQLLAGRRRLRLPKESAELTA